MSGLASKVLTNAAIAHTRMLAGTPPITADVAAILAGLTKAQRGYVMQHHPNEQRMGGYGLDCGCPGLIERHGLNHPVFGSHYRLTPLGLSVRAALQQNDEGETTG